MNGLRSWLLITPAKLPTWICVMLIGATRREYVSGSMDSNASCSNPAYDGHTYAFHSLSKAQSGALFRSGPLKGITIDGPAPPPPVPRREPSVSTNAVLRMPVQSISEQSVGLRYPGSGLDIWTTAAAMTVEEVEVSRSRPDTTMGTMASVLVGLVEKAATDRPHPSLEEVQLTRVTSFTATLPANAASPDVIQ